MECPICLDTFTKNLVKLDCNHIFCINCIMMTHPLKCPWCRAECKNQIPFKRFNIPILKTRKTYMTTSTNIKRYKKILYIDKNNTGDNISDDKPVNDTPVNNNCSLMKKETDVSFSKKCLWCKEFNCTIEKNNLCSECWWFFLDGNDYHDFELESPDGKASRRAIKYEVLINILTITATSILFRKIENKLFTLTDLNTLFDNIIEQHRQDKNDAFLLYKQYTELLSVLSNNFSKNQQWILEHILLSRVIDRWNIELNSDDNNINNVKEIYKCSKPPLILNADFTVPQIDREIISNILEIDKINNQNNQSINKPVNNNQLPQPAPIDIAELFGD